MGAPPTRTTTVFGLVAATRSIRATWLGGIARVSRSKPSDSYDSGRPATITATSTWPAQATASASKAGSPAPESR